MEEVQGILETIVVKLRLSCDVLGKWMRLTLKYEDNGWILDGEVFDVEVGRVRGVRKTLESSQVEPVLRGCLKARVAMIPNFAMGVDGVDGFLEVKNGFNAIRFLWWSEIPDGCEPVAELIKMMCDWSGYPDLIEWEAQNL